MFSRCDFLLGDGQSVLIVLPENLPPAEIYTVAITEDKIKFLADYQDVTEFSYPGGRIYRRIAGSTQVGLVEYPEGEDEFPGAITNVAYVEVRRVM